MTDEQQSSNRSSSISSKRGLVIGIVVLVVIIVLAAVAYNVLAPNMRRGDNLQAAGTASSSTTDGANAANGDDKADTSYEDGKGSAAPEANGSQGSSSRQNDEAVPAPDFSMEDASGNVVQLSSLLGKPTVLNFWASTCGPCQREMPDFQNAYESEGESVQFIMVNISDFNGESVERAKDFIQQNGYTFPVYFSTDRQASVAYGISSIPRTFFIDAGGNVIATAAGMLDERTLQRGLSMIC